MSLEFEFPASLKAEKFIAKLGDKADIELIDKRYCLRTYYDSFDWRLWANGILCEFDRSKTASTLTLRAAENRRIIASAELSEVPSFPSGFMPGKMRSTLEQVLELRALSAVCSIEYETYRLNVVNRDKKTVLRLMIEDYESGKSRVLIEPVKGYERKTETFIELLTGDLNLIAADKPVLLVILALQGRQPKDYSSKLQFDFDPSLRAVIAVKMIYRRLLKTIKDNEQGVLADIDSEFLHDYRVAVRRTRAGLSMLKDVLPKDAQADYADFFSWLGRVTSPARDLDIYLSSFERYKKYLPAAIRDDLNPLHDFLLEARQKAQQDLEHQLKSPKYINTLLAWEQFLKQHPTLNAPESNANFTVKALADLRIWKAYRRVLLKGEAITPDSPAENLHSLRKNCKKLRYLMEFFQHLYPVRKIGRLIKDLKGLQDVLGDFQDCDVRERRIKLFSEEMQQNDMPVETLSAMSILTEAMAADKDSARRRFSSQFERFAQEKNHSVFKSLFAGKG